MLVFPKEVLFSMNIIRRSVTLYNLPLTHYPTPTLSIQVFKKSEI